MKYLSVSETAKRWGLSERTVRNYCSEGENPRRFFNGQNMEYSRKRGASVQEQ